MLKCKVEKKEITSALSLLTSCIPTSSQSTLSSLQNVLIEGHEKGLFLSANNLDTAVKLFIPAETTSLGIVAIPATKMFQVVKSIGEKHILMDTEENNVRIESGSATCNIKVHPCEEMPDFPEIAPKEFVEIDGSVLLNSLGMTIGSVGEEGANNYQLSALAIKAKDNNITVVGCNGNQLTIMTSALSGFTSEGEKPFLIPGKGAKLMQKFLTNQDTVKMGVSENQIILKTGTTLLVNRLQVGEYPQYQGILDMFSLSDTISIPQADIVSALKRTLLFTDNFHAVNFIFTHNSLALSSTQTDMGTASEELIIEYAGEDLTLTFNAKLVLDALTLMRPSDTVNFLVDGHEKSLIIRCKDCPSFLSMIMPIKV